MYVPLTFTSVLRRDGATVEHAGQQPCEGKIVFAIFRFVSSRKSILCLLEQVRGDQRLVGALVLDALRDEPANVERIPARSTLVSITTRRLRLLPFDGNGDLRARRSLR
jgi:hypothetical protein